MKVVDILQVLLKVKDVASESEFHGSDNITCTATATWKVDATNDNIKQQPAVSITLYNLLRQKQLTAHSSQPRGTLRTDTIQHFPT